MKIKICGMKFPKNILEVGALQPDYMGFIFYPKSKRYVGEDFSFKSLEKLPENIKKVAVFVNEDVNRIIEIQNEFSFDFIQLHGNETVAECEILKENNIKIIKVFSVDNYFNFNDVVAYETICDYFLFDTKTPKYGGSGQPFDWELLENYTLSKPFFLSGGLSIHSIGKIKYANYPMLVGLDFNSRLEDTNTKKITEEVSELIEKIRRR
ncbi:phosphoribosylanthranilate isomerase [Flavobacterium macrobrachii]|uniref:N-(5'-phosphoribosyl)anthranilate isomerase n=1 Tax=Flavobacterium macrobrachii TaxID=591204 RepID=A0ABS2CYF3_9FLAO|nr:phosphoribosylanthranilate isomerase [Flavobacterium macrobrachii]MBM6499999.1 phosphoribosylanthranilate isomerase [Flavobacterium macrobrachii]